MGQTGKGPPTRLEPRFLGLLTALHVLQGYPHPRPSSHNNTHSTTVLVSQSWGGKRVESAGQLPTFSADSGSDHRPKCGPGPACCCSSVPWQH